MGGAAPQSYPQARFDISRHRRLLGRDGAAPQSSPQARFDISRRRQLLGREHSSPRSCGGARQSVRLIRKNPQSQPHILFSSRRKENVPLTVQEKRAAGGAVPLWRTPPDPLRSAPRTDAFLPHKSFPWHPPEGIPGAVVLQMLPAHLKRMPFCSDLPKEEVGGRTAAEDVTNGSDFYPTWPRRGIRLRGRFAWSFAQTGVRGLPALWGRAPGALW